MKEESAMNEKPGEITKITAEALWANRAIVDAGLVLLTWGNASVRHPSDTETRRALYQAFPDARAVIHTHSVHAVAWGPNAAAAVENAIVLESVAGIATETRALAPANTGAPQYLTEKHWLRKHGSGAYYGQAGGSGHDGGDR